MTMIVGVIVLPQIIQLGLAGACFPGGWKGMWQGIQMAFIIALILGSLGTVSACITKDAGQAVVMTFGIPFGLLLVTIGLSWSPLGAWFYQLKSGPVWLVFLFLGASSGVWFFWQHYQKPWRRWRPRFGYFGALALLMLGASFPPESARPKATMEAPKGARLEVEDNFEFSRTDGFFSGAHHTQSGTFPAIWHEGGATSREQLRGTVAWKGLPNDWLAMVKPLRSYGPGGQLLLTEDESSEHFQRAEVASSYQQALFPGEQSKRTFRRSSGWPLFTSRWLDPQTLELPATVTTAFATRFYRGRKIKLPGTSGRNQAGSTRLLLKSADKIDGEWLLRFHYLASGKTANVPGEIAFPGFLALLDPTTKQVALGNQGYMSSAGFGNLLKVGDFEISFEGFSSPTDLADLELYHIDQELVGTTIREVEYEVSGE
jgi:hypothetical protein